MYGRVLAANNSEDIFDIYVKPAITNPEDVLLEDENGTTIFNKEGIREECLYFPSHLDADKLEEFFNTQGASTFSNQYMLDTTAVVENTLPFNLIDFYDRHTFNIHDMNVIDVLSDFAYVKSPTADKFAVVCVGEDKKGHWWVFYIYAEREGYSAGVGAMTGKIISLYEEVGRKLKHIVTEVNGQQGVVSDQIKSMLMMSPAQRLVRKDIFIENVPRGDKRNRIGLLEPIIREGKLHIDSVYKQDIITECKNVASGQNGDDILDALCKKLILPKSRIAKDKDIGEMTLEDRVNLMLKSKMGKQGLNS